MKLTGARRHDDQWPAWIPLCLCVTTVAVTVIALAQRRADMSPTWLVVIALGMAGPCLYDFFVAKVPEPLYAGVVLAAVATLMAGWPVEFDLSTLLLYILVGEVAAMCSARISIPAALAAAVILLVNHANTTAGGTWVWAIGVAVCWQVGVTMRVLQLQLQQERELHAERATQAAVEERQRIAREIHDVVAHSLSVTMLHITAARHALTTDGDQPPAAADVSEATDALAQAEQVGRQAMADIRRTVGLLRTSSGVEPPMPGAAEIPTLLEDLRNAGEQVRWSVRGDLDRVPGSVGLGLYRIVQESVANAVKHAPGRPLSVRIDVTKDPARLSLRNQLPGRSRAKSPLDGVAHGGSGVRGMRQRAELLGGTLRAGRRRGHWVVDLRFPNADEPTR